MTNFLFSMTILFGNWSHTLVIILMLASHCMYLDNTNETLRAMANRSLSQSTLSPHYETSLHILLIIQVDISMLHKAMHGRSLRLMVILSFISQLQHHT